MMLDGQPEDRTKTILQDLEAAYGSGPAILPAGPTGPLAPTGPAKPDRMGQIMQDLDAAYPSSFQMVKGPVAQAKPQGGGGILEGLGQVVHTVGAGGYQGLAGWTGMVDQLYDRLLDSEYRQRYEAIAKAPVPGQENMAPADIQAAKMKMFETLGPHDEWLQKRKIPLLANATQYLQNEAQAHAAAGIPMTDNKVLDIARKLYQSAGQAGVDVGVYAAGGPAALPVFGAARGYAQTGDLGGAVVGGAEGALMQGMIHGIGLLPSSVQLPTWFGMGVSITPGGLEEKAVGGLTWAGLGLTGNKNKVTLRDFIERYPKIQKRVDDTAAMKVLQTAAPEVTPEAIQQLGGAKATLDKLVGMKDRFQAVMEVFKKSGQDPKALEAMLNNPDYVPLFKELMGITEQKPGAPALPPGRPEVAPARFQVTPEGTVAGVGLPEDKMLAIQYREAELGRKLTADELSTLEGKPAAATPAEKPAPVPKAEKAPAAPAAMDVQLMGAEEAAKLDADQFKAWLNPRFRVSYDPANPSDLAAYKDAVRALGLRGDDTVMQDVIGRLKPEPPKTPEQPPPAAAPPVAQAIPAPAAPAAAEVAPKVRPTTMKKAAPAELRSGQEGFYDRMVSLQERAARNRAMGKPEPGNQREPMTKTYEASLQKEAAAAGAESLDANRALAKQGDPEGIKAVAETLLTGTGMPKGHIDEFKKNAFMDGEEAKKIAKSYADGEIDFDQATTRLKQMIEEAVTPPTRTREDIQVMIDKLKADAENTRNPRRVDSLNYQVRMLQDEMAKMPEGDTRAKIEAEYQALKAEETAPKGRAMPAKAVIMTLRLKDGTAAGVESLPYDGSFPDMVKTARELDKKVADENRGIPEGGMVTTATDEKGTLAYSVTPDRLRVKKIQEPDFKLTQESWAAKAPAAEQPKLLEPGQVERTMPAGFDNRGLRTWPDAESMRRDALPLIDKGWKMEYGQNADGQVWGKLGERGAAGEGQLIRKEVKVPEFGQVEATQMALPEGFDKSLPFSKPEPAQVSHQEPGLDVKGDVKKAGAKQPTEFDKYYEDLMKSYENPAPPAGKAEVFRIYVTDEYGTEDSIGNFEESLRPQVEAYIKKKDVGKYVKTSPKFLGEPDAYGTKDDHFDFAKDSLNWVAENKAAREQLDLGLEKPTTGEKPTTAVEKPGDNWELGAGLVPPKSLRDRISKMADKLDVENLFKRIGAKSTGLAVKLYHPRRNTELDRAELKARELTKKYKLTPKEYQELTFLASKQGKFDLLSPAEKDRLGPAYRDIRNYFDEYANRLKQVQVIEEPWPASAIRRMKTEYSWLQNSIDEGVVKDPGAVKERMDELGKSIAFLEKSGVKYVNVPRFWMEQFWQQNGDNAPKILTQFFHERKTLDMEALGRWLVEQKYLKPNDLDIRKVIMGYGHMVGHKIGLAEILNAAKKDGVVLPADQAPADWKAMHPMQFPTMRGMKANPEFVNYMDMNFLRNGWSNPAISNVMGTIKSLQFWNPLNLGQYSVIQSLWAGAVLTPKMPKAFGKAFMAFKDHNADYWEAANWGAFSEPYTPSFRMAEKRIQHLISGDALLTKIKNRVNIPGMIYKFSWKWAWELNNYFNMASYEYLKDKGFNPKDAAQIAAKTGGDYASLPPATRRILNKFLFTPSFTISMMKAQGEMFKSGLDYLRDPAIRNGTAPEAQYKKQMAKGFLFLMAGIAGKEMLMHKLGFQTDKFGLKYYKEITDEDGNTRQLVVHMAAPDNVILRYFYDMASIGKADDKLAEIYNRAKWKLHPMFQTAIEVLSNKGSDGTPIRDPWDNPFEAVKKMGIYTARRIIRLSELLPESQGSGNLSKIKAYQALQADLGTIGGSVLSAFSIPYMRSTADRRMMFEMNNMLDVFKKANKAAPTTDEAETEKRMEWLRGELEKIQQRMEDIKQ